FPARGCWGRSLIIASAAGLGVATTGGCSLGVTATASSLSGLADRHHALLRAMNDAQLHAPAVADIDDPGVLVTGDLALFRGADLVDLRFGDDGSGRRVSRPGLRVDRQRNQNRRREQDFQRSVLHCLPPELDCTSIESPKIAHYAAPVPLGCALIA